MNQYYNGILNWKDKRFIEIFNKLTYNIKNQRDDLRQDFCLKLIKYDNSFLNLEGEQIYYYSITILKRIITSYSKHGLNYDTEVEIEIPYEYDYDKNVDIGLLYSYLEKLPFYERELIKLYYLEDNTYRDIKDLTKIPITSLNTSMNKIIKKIRKHYGVDNK